MSEKHSTNRGLEKYFGQAGPFAAARDLVQHRTLPAEVIYHAATLGTSDDAYMLGYAFGIILKLRGLRISQDDLTQIGWMKISTGRPSEFENGFRAHQAKNPA